MLLLALACLSPRQVDQLIASNAEIATALTTSQTALAECESSQPPPPAPKPSAAEELEAQTLNTQITDAIGMGDVTRAKELMAKLMDELGHTEAADRAKRTAMELEIVGRDVPSLDQVDWWQGQYDPQANATLFIFWEVWCPHCRREVLQMNETWKKYKDQGLQVVGLTRVTSATEEGAKEFMAENELGYIIGRDRGGQVSAAFGVQGIPAAAVVQDGKVVWRGHPGRLSEEAFALWLK